MRTQEKPGSAGRPGVMIYFDMVEPILPLKDAEKGRLLMAIVEYARDGTEPRFTGRLALAWGYIQPKLDRDAEVYEYTKTQRKYAAFCKRRSALKLPKIPIEQWMGMDENERIRMLTGDNETQRAVDPVDSRYPTGKGDGDGNGEGYGEGYGNGYGYGDAAVEGYGNGKADTALSGGEISSLAAAAAERKLKKLHGELGQGVVNLSEYHIDRLLDQMGLEMFDYYVKKLSDFILKNGASVKNHYTTILRWWQEDNAL